MNIRLLDISLISNSVNFVSCVYIQKTSCLLTANNNISLFFPAF